MHAPSGHKHHKHFYDLIILIIVKVVNHSSVFISQDTTVVDAELLAQLLYETDSAILAGAVTQHNFSLQTIQWLKERMESLQTTDPAQGVRMAELAQRLAAFLPPPAVALSHWTMGNALLYVSRYSEAAKQFDLAKQAYWAIHARLDAARMSVGYVGVLAYTGDAQKAIDLAGEVENLLLESAATDKADLRRLGILLMNKAAAYVLLGQFEEAATIHQRHFEIAQQLENLHMMGQAKHNLAFALVQTGSLEESLLAYSEAAQYFEQAGAMTDLARAKTNLGAVFGRLSRTQKARQTLQKASAILMQIEGSEQQRNWLFVLQAWVESESGDTVDASTITLLQSAGDSFSQFGPPYAEGLCYVILGHCQISRGQWQEAADAFAKAKQTGERIGDRHLTARALHGLGKLAVLQNQLDEAVSCYLAAIDEVEIVRQSLHTEAFCATYLTDKLAVYQDLVELYLHLGKLDAAFEIVERAKAKLLSEKLAARLQTEVVHHLDLQDEVLQGMNQRLKEALSRLDSLYATTQVHQFRSLEESQSLSVEQAASVKQLEEQVKYLTQQIQRRKPIFSLLTAGEIVGATQISRRLRQASLLQYHKLHDRYGVFIVKGDGSIQHQVLATVDQIDSAVEQMRASINHLLSNITQFGNDRAVRHLSTYLASTRKQLTALHNLLIAPLLPYISNSTQLIVAPDGILHALPFHALFDGNRYLLEEHEIVYTPAATVLEMCLSTHSSAQSVALFGYDSAGLKAVNREIDQVATLLPTAECFIGDIATTENFLHKAPLARMLHVASHAAFRSDSPMLSSLALADRRLTLAEIAQLALKCELVVLSGCETGYGKMQGADLISLSSGFIGAGAHSLLVSLWRVDDQATAMLMTHFYQNLLHGMTRSNALRFAQLTLLEQGRASTDADSLYQHPAFWAPFTLLGNWHPIESLV